MADALLWLWPGRGGETTHGARYSARHHECPGRCGSDVRNRHHSCQLCWWRLPPNVRAALNATAGRGFTDFERRIALQAAVIHFERFPIIRPVRSRERPRSAAVGDLLTGWVIFAAAVVLDVLDAMPGGRGTGGRR